MLSLYKAKLIKSKKVIILIAILIMVMIFLAKLISSLSLSGGEPDSENKCDSCAFHVVTLDEPFDLIGHWLFTRNDHPDNSQVELDTSDWVLARAPGPWSKLYSDRKNFRVGWYRGEFHFDESLIGSKANIFIDAYLSDFSVFFDGKKVYERYGSDTNQRYYAAQPLPVFFTIDKSHYVVSIRVDTPTMMGIYQAPFEIRAYRKSDPYLAFVNFWSSDFRFIVTYMALFFGFFFIMVYFKTRDMFYLVVGLSGIGLFPYGALFQETFVDSFNPESMLLLHYIGIGLMILFQLFVPQFFYKQMPRLNIIYSSIILLLALSFIYSLFDFHLDFFQVVRKILFLFCIVVAITIIGYSVYSIKRVEGSKKKDLRILLFGAIAFVVTQSHDLGMALGLYSTLFWGFGGIFIQTFCVLLVASKLFANTFVKNKLMVREFKVLNENLEDIVDERTVQLSSKIKDIHAILKHIPEGILTIIPNQLVHSEYSDFLEEILENKQIAGRDVFDVLFKHSDLRPDTLSSISASIWSSLEYPSMIFYCNSHLLPTEMRLLTKSGKQKNLEMAWTPIVNSDDITDRIMLVVRDVTSLKETQESSNQQKRELQIIGEILAVSEQKFYHFSENSSQLIKSSEKILRESSQLDRSITDRLFRNIHTLKGNARTLGFQFLTNRLHETETNFQLMIKLSNSSSAVDEFLQELKKNQELLNEYEDISNIKLGRSENERRRGSSNSLLVDRDCLGAAKEEIKQANLTDIKALTSSVKAVQRILALIGTTPFEDVIKTTVAGLSSLAESLGKVKPVVNIEKTHINLNNQIKDIIENSFVHLLNNAMDHGIESSQVRQHKGKPAVGSIMVKCYIEDEQLIITCSDDGQGLNLVEIKNKAVNMGILENDCSISDQEIANLIFEPRLSTSNNVTEVSGRGVGMDAARAFFEEGNGSASVQIVGERDSDGRVPFQVYLTLPAFVAFDRRLKLKT